MGEPLKSLSEHLLEKLHVLLDGVGPGVEKLGDTQDQNQLQPLAGPHFQQDLDLVDYISFLASVIFEARTVEEI